MKYLLQELRDIERYKNCLTRAQYRDYKDYLLKRLLKEVAIKDIYGTISNDDRSKKSTDQRFEELLGRFKNTKHYETEKDRETGKVKRLSGIRTNLQFDDGTYCTKKEFEDEFLKYEFDDNTKARKLLKQFTDLFDDEGWLIID